MDLSLVAYEFGRRAAPGPLVATNVVAAALSAHGAHPDVLAGLLSGDVVATWCGPAVEPDGWSPTVEARRDGAGFVLDGEARVVESAGQAAHLLVTCADGEGDSVTQLLVPADAAGIVVTPMATIDLSRRFGLVTFECAHVGAAAVVGTAGTAAVDVDRQ